MKNFYFGLLILFLSFSCQNNENSASADHQKSEPNKGEGIEVNLPRLGASAYTFQSTASPTVSLTGPLVIIQILILSLPYLSK